MQYPKFRNYASRDLVDVYRRHIGVHEVDDRASIDALPKGHHERVARLIGRGCWLLHTQPGSQKEATHMIRDCERRASRATLKTPEGRQLRLSGLTASLLLAKDSTEQKTVRQAMHSEVITQLTAVSRVLHANFKRPYLDEIMTQHLSGERAHLTLLGLTTRINHPGNMAITALTHHDRGRGKARPSNHDLVFLSDHSLQDEPEIRRVQIKGACLGLCDGDTTKMTPANRYSPDITLVSAHCDITTAPPKHARHVLTHVGDMLATENADKAPFEVIDELDGLSGRLLVALTMDDPRRMGRATVHSANLPLAA